MNLNLRGAMTALVTPFDANGNVDQAALERLVEWQISEGIHGLVPCGTTGEGATLDGDEQERVIECVVRVAAGRVPVIAGCGSNDTRRTVEAAQRAVGVGADALLVVTPYYNKPNASGMRAHYQSVADATEKPIVLYNVPGRTGQNLSAEQTLELAKIPGIVAVKEASADLDQISTILRERPQGFALLSGDDPLALPTMALGAEGIISVVSNEAPRAMAALIDAAASGSMERARELHYRLLPLMRTNFAESNPVPVKHAMSLLGLCEAHLRPPLGAAEPATIEALQRALELAGIEAVVAR
jgi:4-hydroxy-tetrahydrodipicolinate synthase